MIASARERVAIGARAERQLVGTAGERIAMSRMLWSGGPEGGRFEIEYLGMNEVDEAGQFTAIILFDPDDARAAKREAWARWATIDPVAAPWVALLTEIADAWNAHDRASVRRVFADDVVVEDHRRTGLGRVDGADAYIEANAVLWDLAPDQRIEFGWSWPALDRHAALLTLRREGTLADGGAFEIDYLFLSVADHGRITRLELFEPEDLDKALARFDELRPDPLRIAPSAATRAADRIREIYLTRDWDALRDLAAPDFVYHDRGKRALVVGDVETWTGAMQFTRQPEFRTERSLLAALGDRIALDRVLWAGKPGGDAFEFERIRLLETGSDGRVRFAIFFDPEDRVAVFSEALERFLAGEAAAMNGRAAVLESQRAHARRDWIALRETMAPDFVFQDHRTLGMLGVLDRDGWIASTRALVAMSPDHAVEWSRMLAWNRHGFVAVTRTFGTVPDGGPFENVFLSVRLMVGDLTQRFEFFNIGDADRALARFEELCASADADPGIASQHPKT